MIYIFLIWYEKALKKGCLLPRACLSTVRTTILATGRLGGTLVASKQVMAVQLEPLYIRKKLIRR